MTINKQRTKSSIVLQCIQMHNVRPVNSESPLMWAHVIRSHRPNTVCLPWPDMLDPKGAFRPEPLVLFNLTGVRFWWWKLSRTLVRPKQRQQIWTAWKLGLFAKESKRGSNLECFWKSQWGNKWLAGLYRLLTASDVSLWSWCWTGSKIETVLP